MTDDNAPDRPDDAGRPEVSFPQEDPSRIANAPLPDSAHEMTPGRASGPPIRWLELIGVLSLITLADLAVYRGAGFAGFALLFAAAPFLFWLSSSRRFTGTSFWVTGGMLLVLAAKLVWCGSAALVVIGFSWLIAFTMALAGFCPYVPELVTYAAQTIQAGILAIIYYARRFSSISIGSRRGARMSFVLPILAFLAFSCIFILANPDLALTFGEGLQRVLDVLRGWIKHFSPEVLEICFWGAALWVVLGLLCPVFSGSTLSEVSSNGQKDVAVPPAESPLYHAFRNTLLTVIALFAVYLIFEFSTLWFREFPKGFHYSGYAHEGAAWLTAALALATLTLSLVFRGGVLRDPRIVPLRRLAWIWSFENLVLAVAVYHRLFIYIGFNGMTPMRIMGLYGMTAVVVGFMLVLVKIARNRGFLWLIRRHLWTLAIAITLLMLTPRDTIVVEYNTRKILSGDPAPCVQISVQPISSEGVLLLKPLLECDDEIIREGVAALLAERAIEAERTAAEQERLGWTAYQISDRMVLKRLRADAALWSRYSDRETRNAALERFHKYAYQWY